MKTFVVANSPSSKHRLGKSQSKVLLGGTGEGELCGSHTVRAGISPDYNHLFSLNKARMIKVKNSLKDESWSGWSQDK